MFEEMLEFKQVILLCYGKQKKKSLYHQTFKAHVCYC
jgi:hypothetical protein